MSNQPTAEENLKNLTASNKDLAATSKESLGISKDFAATSKASLGISKASLAVNLDSLKVQKGILTQNIIQNAQLAALNLTNADIAASNRRIESIQRDALDQNTNAAVR
jgi:hypothetical protein